MASLQTPSSKYIFIYADTKLLRISAEIPLKFTPHIGIENR